MDKKYDVAVYGLWYGNNYGSIITYYALSKVLESMGKTYAMIRNPLGIEIDIDGLRRSHPLKFAKGRYDITPLYRLHEMHKLNEMFDAFLLGSDQMWNYHLSRPYKQSYFFDFADDDKIKVAYATSYGKDTYIGPDEERPITQTNLQRFDAISVRDDFSKRICEQDFKTPATLVLDPVFLCPVEKYNDLIAESDFSVDGEFIFAYVLDPNPRIGGSIQKIAETTGKNVIVVFNESSDKEKCWNALHITAPNVRYLFEPTVQEWLYLYKNAKFVVTDSFHGSCFSIIFRRSFVVLKNNGRGGSRFNHLLGGFGLMNYMVESPEAIADKFMELGIDHQVDYQAAYEKINAERERSMAWFEHAINTHVKKPVTLPTPICDVLDMKKCTGCSACANVCPVNAITMQENAEGFLNPVVDRAKCVDCGLCVKKCIAVNPQYKNAAEPKCFAMMADTETRKISSSGGMFSVAAEYILERGGYVCGAVYTDDFRVEHAIISDPKELYRMRGSKYMQSNPKTIYREVKELLTQGKLVLFTGMPCQVAALYAYLGKEYDTLYTIDLLCHGITSSKVFEKYHQEVLDGKQLTRLEFKAKEPWGWHAGVNAYFADGTHYAKPLESDMYFIAYLKSIAKNTVCGDCPANKLPRQGDLTIGDFWGIPKLDPSMSDNKGTSVVLVNNPKAQQFFDELKSRMMACREEPLESAIRGNQIIRRSYKLHKNRDAFFEHFDTLDFTSLTKGCYYNTLHDELFQALLRSVPKEDHEFYYLAKAAAEHAGGRRIVTWVRSPKFAEILRKHFNLNVAFAVTMKRENANGKTVKHISELRGHKNEYYVVALDPGYSGENYKALTGLGYLEIYDFIFRKPKPIVLENFNCAQSRYADAYGNTIEGFDGVIGKVIFRGCNNHIVLGKSIGRPENLELDLTANTTVRIGEETRFTDTTRIMARGHNGSSEVTIKERCRFTDALIRLFNDTHTSSVLINENCTFETDLEVHANAGKKIVIGRDCMFSHDIDLWAGDGHSVFDVKTGKNTNTVYDNQSVYKNMLVIGEHVWVAKGAFIMHGTNIGNGSIVGAQSVVKGTYPNNCTISGNPASVVKTDSAWARDMVTDDMSKCGEGYAALTSYAKAPISGLNVLVIGGAFAAVDSALIKKLLALGNHVTFAARANRKSNFGSNVHFIPMEISDAENAASVLAGLSFDVVYDNMANCSSYVDHILSNVKCRQYIQLSSAMTYPNLTIDMQEAQFDPLGITMELCDPKVGYIKGKRQAEAIAYQNSAGCKAVTVRIPYVARTERLYYYCKHIVNQTPMNIDDTSRCFPFIRDTEVGSFLPWIAAQNFEGPVNLASTGVVTIQMILSYIEKKVGKKAIIDTAKGEKEPFHEFGESSYSLNMNKAQQLGYHTSDIHEWFWKMLDQYIDRALREAKK
ncbi:MAG: Coenzyme F420 hydrogenase/dehydrogenase, beta subunit C-terminal domain [Ruminococcus sp.]|nr:Coenzyme F420 hydrogenase/dehydrogenase, beta subunit C-terminal domain [Oscillospiraceae bacterium]MBQ8686946.1 Coenzyme F420 hydrogenase/dehydrogenase, beta subunit C-terminal domain [Ruminococcus sp.]